MRLHGSTTPAPVAGVISDRIYPSHKAAAERCGVSEKYLRHAIKNGRGPARLKPTKRKTLFREGDLVNWMAKWEVVQ